MIIKIINRQCHGEFNATQSSLVLLYTVYNLENLYSRKTELKKMEMRLAKQKMSEACGCHFNIVEKVIGPQTIQRRKSQISLHNFSLSITRQIGGAE